MGIMSESQICVDRVLSAKLLINSTLCLRVFVAKKCSVVNLFLHVSVCLLLVLHNILGNTKLFQQLWQRLFGCRTLPQLPVAVFVDGNNRFKINQGRGIILANFALIKTLFHQCHFPGLGKVRGGDVLELGDPFFDKNSLCIMFVDLCAGVVNPQGMVAR